MGEPAEKLDDAPSVSKIRVLHGKMKAQAEKITSSYTAIKAESMVKDATHVVCETSGFIAWQLGRIFTPLRRVVRREIEKYREEVGE